MGLPVKTVDELACGCHLGAFIDMLKQHNAPQRLLTVGHNPDCGEIISGLLGDFTKDYSLKKGAIASLEGTPQQGGMKLSWIKT